MCKMLGDRHEIILYCPESAPVPGVSESVHCLSDAERISIFGEDDTNRLPDWPNDDQSLLFNLRIAAAIAERARPDDLVLLSQGLTHLPIKTALPKMWCCEPGIGYEGVIGGNVFGAYESHAWRHFISCKNGFKDIRTYDTVIHPYCDPDEFPILNNGKGEYLVFLGRLIQRKGVQIAVEIAKRAKLPLYVAGAGGKSETLSSGITKITGLDVTVEGDLKHIGPVDVAQRAELLAGARALICPTLYLEPGANVAIEAQLAGTPVITHNWGVFSETVQHGVNGFHFQILREAVAAVQKCSELDPSKIRQYAIDRFSLAAIGPKFDIWFNVLATLREKGWYAE
jgi:glycosyltransferase involved in cell wall biosynthesis